MPWIRSVASTLEAFHEDDPDNLICLCPNHHRQFHPGKRFALVPSPDQRALTIQFEERDFAERLACVERGEPDPGRKLPQLSYEFEYIPIYYPIPFCFVHNPNIHDNSLFIFDTTDTRVCPLLHFQASHFALCDYRILEQT